MKQVLAWFKEGTWFDDENARRHSRMLWEGLFFMFWHSDKSIYQRDTSLKIAGLFPLIQGESTGLSGKQKQWVESWMYIFNKHWDKVDNFRIDKYLMLVRNMINALFSEFKRTSYQSEDLKWFADCLKLLVSNAS